MAVQSAKKFAGTPGIGGALAYLFKNPERVGGFIPSIQHSYCDGKRKALEAKTTFVKLKELDVSTEPRPPFHIIDSSSEGHDQR